MNLSKKEIAKIIRNSPEKYDLVYSKYKDDSELKHVSGQIKIKTGDEWQITDYFFCEKCPTITDIFLVKASSNNRKHNLKQKHANDEEIEEIQLYENMSLCDALRCQYYIRLIIL